MVRSGWNSALLVGFFLVALGVGNWAVSANKMTEYALRAANSEEDTGTGLTAGEFPHLPPTAHRTLLKRLNRGDGSYSFEGAKLDFYQVISSGGRLLALAGLLVIITALLMRWARRRAGSRLEQHTVPQDIEKGTFR